MSSDDLAAERERIERQILELERSLGPESNSLDLITLSSDNDSEDGSDDRSNPDLVSAGDLEAERLRVQREIEELERSLGSNINLLPDEDGGGSASEGSEEESEEEELVLPQTSETCLQMNLVYQEVLSEKMQELERLLADNIKQQKDLVAQMSGLHPSEGNAAPAGSAYPPPQRRYLGHFLKPYFKDRITGLGPPANPETKEKIRNASRGLDKVKIRKWMGWQKTLLKQAIVRDGMRRLIQPKLSLVDYLMEKMSKVNHEDREVLRQQLIQVDKEVEEIRLKTEEELIGGRYDDHDWQKISNIDFEGTREADNIKLFWQNFLHPSINKNTWKEEEIDKLSKLAAMHRYSNWERIAAHLGTNRTGFMCLQTYQRYIAKNFKRSVWESHEDDILRQLVAKMRVGNFIPYTQMSYFMVGREPGQLMYRWTMVLEPSLKKGPWSKEEDKMLLAAVAKYGCKSWYKVKFEVPGRNDGQCRDRYLDCLKEDVNRGPWEPEEVALLKVLVQKHGEGKWAKIAAEIPNRLDHQCMQQWRRVVGYRQKSYRKKNANIARDRRCNAVRSIKKRLIKLEEGDLSSEDEADEEVHMEFMDSDGEQKMMKEEEEVKEVEEEEQEYSMPPMERWIPTWNLQSRGPGTLHTQLVELPGVDSFQVERNPASPPLVRCTILDRFGNQMDSVVVTDPPILAKKDNFNLLAMVKVPFVDVKNLMLWRGLCASRKKLKKKPNESTFYTHTGLHHALLAAVSPWVGHLLLPAPLSRYRRWEADVWRVKAEAVGLTTTPVFLFFLQVLHIDTLGCKKTIDQRKSARTVVRTVTPKSELVSRISVANWLKQIRDQKQQSDMQAARGRAQAPPATPFAMVPQPLFTAQPMVQGPGLPLQAHSLPVRGTGLPVRASPFPVQLPGHPGVCFVMAPVQQHLSPTLALPAPPMVFSLPGQPVSLISTPTPHPPSTLLPLPHLPKSPAPTPSSKTSAHTSFPGQPVSLISTPTPHPPSTLLPLPHLPKSPAPTPSSKTSAHTSFPGQPVSLISTPTPHPPSTPLPLPHLPKSPAPTPSSKTSAHTSFPGQPVSLISTPTPHPPSTLLPLPHLPKSPAPTPSSKTSTPTSFPGQPVSLISTPTPHPPSTLLPLPHLPKSPAPILSCKTSAPTSLPGQPVSLISTPTPHPPSTLLPLRHLPKSPSPTPSTKTSAPTSFPGQPVSLISTPTPHPPSTLLTLPHLPKPPAPTPSSKTSTPTATPSSQPTPSHVSNVNLSSIPSPNPPSKTSIPTPTPSQSTSKHVSNSSLSSTPSPNPSSQTSIPTPSSQPTPNHVSNPSLSSTPTPDPTPTLSSLLPPACSVQPSPGAISVCPGGAGVGPGPPDSPSVQKRIRRPTEKARALMEASKRTDKTTPGPSNKPLTQKRTRRPSAKAKAPRRKKARTQNPPDPDRPIGNLSQVILPPQTTAWMLTAKGLVPLGGVVQVSGSYLCPLDIKLSANGAVPLPVLSQQADLNTKPQTPSTLSNPNPQTVSLNPSSKPHTIPTNPHTAQTISTDPNVNPRTTSTNPASAATLSTNPNPGRQTFLTNPDAAPKLSANPAEFLQCLSTPRVLAVPVNTVIGPSSSAPFGQPQQHPSSGPLNYTLIGPPQQQPLPGPPPSYILLAQQPGTLPPGVGPILRHGPPGSSLILRQASPGAGPILRQASPGARPILRQASPGAGPILRQASPGTGLILRQVPTGSAPPTAINEGVQVEPLSAKMHFMDPSMMFLKEPSQVEREWQAGKAGVEVPGAEVALPYLAPFSTSLASLSVLLRCKKALTSRALQLLTPEEQAASEDERVAAIRQVVAERFGRNPAYAMLKARFLSCYTLPAFLATINPNKLGSPEDEFEDREMWEWRGEELVFKLPSAMQSSRLKTDGTGAPATHYSGLGS